MATPPRENPVAPTVLEGIIAVHKPSGMTSADAIRQIGPKINASKLFQPYLEREKGLRSTEPEHERRKRRNKKLEVKIGHGGTLDPMASGVLVLGLGQGTKSLEDFLRCTKEYVAELILGCSTDTYDRTGKRMHLAPYEHITKEKVEEALAQFRGDIMQKPPLYSALRINGKRFYEYAREGKQLPIEIEARPVKCLELELLEFKTEHNWTFPKEESTNDNLEMEKLVAEAETGGEEAKMKLAEFLKRKTEKEEEETIPKSKRRKLNKENYRKQHARNADGSVPADVAAAASESEVKNGPENKEEPSTKLETEEPPAFDGPKPPVVKLRMVVSSGFYVRSLIHDLGIALGSAANMVSLSRSRQGDYALGKNTIEWEDFMSENGAWEPKAEEILSDWVKRNAYKLTRGQPQPSKRPSNFSGEVGFKRINLAQAQNPTEAEPTEKEDAVEPKKDAAAQE